MKPVVTYVLMGLCLLAFLAEMAAGGLDPEPALRIKLERGASDDERVIVIENSGVRGFDPAALAEWEAGA